MPNVTQFWGNRIFPALIPSSGQIERTFLKHSLGNILEKKLIKTLLITRENALPKNR